MYQNVNDLLLLNLVIEVTYTERVVGAAESGSLVCVGFSPLLLPTVSGFLFFFLLFLLFFFFLPPTCEFMCGCFTEEQERETSCRGI